MAGARLTSATWPNTAATNSADVRFQNGQRDNELADTGSDRAVQYSRRVHARRLLWGMNVEVADPSQRPEWLRAAIKGLYISVGVLYESRVSSYVWESFASFSFQL